jgi:hypothetical protein
MILLMDYVTDVTHALKVGFFLSIVGAFLTVLIYIAKIIKDENGNNQ